MQEDGLRAGVRLGREAYRRLSSSRRLFIIHHWDMDGVASAVVASRIASGVVGAYTPPITYRLTRRILDEIEAGARASDAVAVVDLAYPGPTLALIHRRVRRRMVVVDHHVQPEPPAEPGLVYYNPAARGDPLGEWPSAAHVLASMKGLCEEPLLVAASIVGDLGPSAKGNRHYRFYMEQAGLDPDEDYDLVKEACVDNIDGAVAMGRVDVIGDVVKRAAFYGEPACETIMKDHLLVTLKVRAEAELREILEKAEPEEAEWGALVYRLVGEGVHASRLARELSKRSPGRLVVVSYYSRNLGQGRVYARVHGSSTPPLGDAVACLRSLGYSAGGKTQAGNNVVAVEVDGRELDRALEDLLAVLRGLVMGDRRCPSPRPLGGDSP